MHFLFLDEFGNEAKPGTRGQLPNFGYGGFLIAPEMASSFATMFFDLKLEIFLDTFGAKVRNEMYTDSKTDLNYLLNRRPRKEHIETLERLYALSPHQRREDPDLIHLCAKYEVKGREAFAVSYLEKQRRVFENNSDYSKKAKKAARKKYSAVLSRIRDFCKILNDHNVEIFFEGFHKRNMPTLREHERLHVKMMSPIVKSAHQMATRKRSSVKMFFDHHLTDDDAERLDTSGRKFLTPGRHERVRQIVMSNKYYDVLVEPSYSAKSHYSQCVQAADWICTILQGYFAFHDSSKDFRKYEPFYFTAEDYLQHLVAPESSFRGRLSRLSTLNSSRQLNLPLEPAQNSARKILRPYKH